MNLLSSLRPALAVVALGGISGCIDTGSFDFIAEGEGEFFGPTQSEAKKLSLHLTSDAPLQRFHIPVVHDAQSFGGEIDVLTSAPGPFFIAIGADPQSTADANAYAAVDFDSIVSVGINPDQNGQNTGVEVGAFVEGNGDPLAPPVELDIELTLTVALNLSTADAAVSLGSLEPRVE